MHTLCACTEIYGHRSAYIYANNRSIGCDLMGGCVLSVDVCVFTSFVCVCVCVCVVTTKYIINRESRLIPDIYMRILTFSRL